MTIKIVLNRLTEIWPFQPFNLFLYTRKIDLRQQHVFYKIVKLKSKLSIQLYTNPPIYIFYTTGRRWPSGVEICYQIKDIKHTSCTDGKLCPFLCYITQWDYKGKKITIITSVNKRSEKLSFFTVGSSREAMWHLWIPHPFKVLLICTKIKKLQDLYEK
jgi:hypothetical protein